MYRTTRAAEIPQCLGLGRSNKGRYAKQWWIRRREPLSFLLVAFGSLSQVKRRLEPVQIPLESTQFAQELGRRRELRSPANAEGVC
jgi:hypothetical protein